MTLTADLLRRSWRDWISGELDRASPEWLQWLWTFVFAALIGLGFTIVGMAVNAGRHPERWLDAGLWWRWYRVNFVVALTVTATIHLLFMIFVPWVGKARIRAFSDRQRAAFFSAIPMTGVIIGWPLGAWLVGQDMAQWSQISNVGELLSSIVIALLISFAFVLIFSARARQAVAEKRATEAQLRLLQGQMEPHFLFNTLANVQSLIEHEPRQARQMIEAFTDYLRASLGGMRREHSTVGDEIDLARSYLELIGTRMAERLRYTIVCAEDLRALPLPPLLLQPLVENAVHHGLEPKVEGGQVTIEARCDGAALWITVRDDGLGLNAPPRPGARPGNGVALDNLRQRLQAAYGSDARVELRDATPGTLATVQVPLPSAAT